MATDLRVTSEVGYKKSISAFDAIGPQLETVLDLNGVRTNSTPLGVRVLSITTTTNYLIDTGTTSSAQTITISNIGTERLAISKIEFEKNGTIPRPEFGSDWFISSVTTGTNLVTYVTSIGIEAGSSKTFDLAYYGPRTGQFSNRIVITSNAPAINSRYVSFTFQDVQQLFSFRLIPLGYVTTSTRFSQITYHDFTTNYFNGTTSTMSYSLAGSSGFSITTSSVAGATVQFNNLTIGNVNGTYTATLTAITGGLTATATLSHTVNITPGLYAQYGTWISPAAPNNSIVGFSYDLIEGVKTLTIGIGGGADGSSSFLPTTLPLLLASNLSIQGGEFLNPYQYWSVVYRIPLDETARTYYTKNYLVKLQGNSYDRYFGDNLGNNSIFIVEDDGHGNLLIKINKLKEQLSDDDNFNITLQNLTRVLFYYSPIDIGGRYYQLGTPKGDGSQTDLFAGFNNDGSIRTYLVAYPTQP